MLIECLRFAVSFTTTQCIYKCFPTRMNHIFHWQLEDCYKIKRFFPVPRRDGKCMEIFFLFFIFLFFENLNRNSAHVMLDKQKFSLLVRICVSLFMGKTVKGDTTWFRKMMFCFECFGRISEIIFWINGNWQRTPTSPEEWNFHSLIMCALLLTPHVKTIFAPIGALSSMKT